MEQVWRSVRPLLLLIPLGLTAVAVATLAIGLIRVRHGAAARTAFRTAAVDATLAASVASVLILTLPPSIRGPRAVNLTPFAELRHTVGDNGVSQLLGNAIIFMPLGFLAPLKWRGLHSIAAIALASLACSLMIETLQFVLPTGRQTSVTDVIMNVLGALTGYLLMVVARGVVRSVVRAPAETRSSPSDH
jgi:glycopeptide antibiotics resistance protein